MFRESKNILYTCVTVGIVLLASKYRNNVLSSVKHICRSVTGNKKDKSENNECSTISRNDSSQNNKCSSNNYSENCSDGSSVKKEDFKISLEKVILADSPEKCDYAIQRIRHNLSDGILGFDCEWVNEDRVSLLQIATFNGVCALFRLNKIGFIPPKLKELLSNRYVLKVGVDPLEDGRRLTRDYGCRVFGTLDLRTLAEQYKLPSQKSLSALCMQYLGIELDKILEVRCSNWNADVLTDEQIAYAAYDVLTAILIYYRIQEQAKQNRSTWQNVVIYINSICNNGIEEKYYCLPSGIIDARFKAKNQICNSNNIDNNNNNKSGQVNRKISNIPARNKPLYHNCYLQAPDGEILCTCDKKKAEWYVSKELGQVVSTEPFTVRLKFEPSGRALGEVGKYYTQIKVNQCVVCGASDKFIRKNVVPREYRKYFPLVMKAHQSHDILLLCPTCHDKSNYYDLQLRRQLANVCNAPMSGPVTVQNEVLRNYQMLHSAVEALRGNSEIPPNRRVELAKYIRKCTGLSDFSQLALENLSEQITAKMKQSRKSNSSCIGNNQNKSQPHGLKVVEYFESIEGGLVELEKTWREHFLKSMEPQFLPELWSVSHNQERLTLRQTQNRIEAHDAKLAGLKS